MRSRFEPDRQLTARLVVTMFLLGLVYVAFIAALIVLLKSIVLVVVIAAGLLGAQCWYSDRIALNPMRGRLVTAEEQPRLHGVIDRLCTTADMPKPRVAISTMDLPNAFATGRNAGHAVVCVTTGLQRRLTTEEFECVPAHELSPVAHRDVAVISIASFLGVLAEAYRPLRLLLTALQRTPARPEHHGAARPRHGGLRPRPRARFPAHPCSRATANRPPNAPEPC